MKYGTVIYEKQDNIAWIKLNRPMHGLNGDILVWNPVTRRRHELTSMGIRVNSQTLKKQLEITGQLDFL